MYAWRNWLAGALKFQRPWRLCRCPWSVGTVVMVEMSILRLSRCDELGDKVRQKAESNLSRRVAVYDRVSVNVQTLECRYKLWRYLQVEEVGKVTNHFLRLISRSLRTRTSFCRWEGRVRILSNVLTSWVALMVADCTFAMIHCRELFSLQAQVEHHWLRTQRDNRLGVGCMQGESLASKSSS